MTIDPKTLPDGAVVETTDGDLRFICQPGYYVFRDEISTRGEVPNPWSSDRKPARVFVPVPDGVAYDDALRAVQDARPWVEVPSDQFGHLPQGSRLRTEWVRGNRSGERYFVHPDDVPDSDADLIERIAAALCDAEDDPDRYHSWVASEGDEAARDAYRQQARAALAVVREDGAR